MSAAAVAAVRRGLRTALDVARRAGVPKTHISGAPSRRTTGRLSNALMTHTPIMTMRAPMPTCAAALAALPVDRAGDEERADHDRRRHRRPPECASDRSGRATPSRIAATGGMRTRAKRREPRGHDSDKNADDVGRDNRVRLEDQRAARASIRRPRSSRARARRSRRAMPNARPTVDATMPTMNDSPRTAAITCRRLAPMARSNASSRVRCATSIVNVFKMMNRPTNKATPAKISKNTLKKPSALLIAADCSLFTAAPVTASNPFGRVGADARGERVLRHAACRVHVDLVHEAGLAGDLLRGRRIEHAQDGARQVATAAHGGDADDRGLQWRTLSLHRHRIADMQVVGVGRALVDGDLARQPPARALNERQATRSSRGSMTPRGWAAQAISARPPCPPRSPAGRCLARRRRRRLPRPWP